MKKSALEDLKEFYLAEMAFAPQDNQFRFSEKLDNLIDKLDFCKSIAEKSNEWFKKYKNENGAVSDEEYSELKEWIQNSLQEYLYE